MSSFMPRKITAGDSLDLLFSEPDYPAPEWTLRVVLNTPTAVHNFAAVAEGTDHRLTLTTAHTGSIRPGRYFVTFYATTEAGARKTINTHWAEVAPNPANPAGADPRSHARRMLDAIEAALEGRATKAELDLVSASVGGTISAARDPKILVPLRDKYRAEVRAEDLAAGVGVANKMTVRFRG